MRIKRLIFICVALILGFTTLFVVSCDNNNNNNNYTDDIINQYFDPTLPDDGIMEFTCSIMNIESFERIIPLGQIRPSAHTFPTDHIYFVLKGSGHPIYAPCGGKIIYIAEDAVGDGIIRIGVTNSMTYYISHIYLNKDLKEGDMVSAGNRIGTSMPIPCVDFGVLNKNIDNGFLSQKHPIVTMYGDKPLSYYTEPLRSELYALVKPPRPYGEPDYVYDRDKYNVTDGEFALDKAGTLRGNWFQEGGFSAGGWYEWDITLSFGYDVFYPDKIVIGCGKYEYSFATKKEDNPVRPEDVSTSSGTVVYYLYDGFHTGKEGEPIRDRIGLMLVQMLSDTRIKLEIFDDTTSESREFTNAAIYYTR